MTKSQLQAAKSHFSAKRDEAKSNLELLTSSGNSKNPQQDINFWLKELSDSLSVLSTINLIFENELQEQKK